MKQTFSSLDLWLFDNWAASKQLSDAMDSVREKYEAVCNRVVATVQDDVPELDTVRIWMKRYQCIGFGRTSWPTPWPTWPAGIWLDGLGLDALFLNEGDSCCAAIWVPVSGRATFDPATARTKLKKAASIAFKAQLPDIRYKDPEDEQTLLFYYLPESRQALRQMLLEENAEPFVQCLKRHVMLLAQLIPVLDEILLP